MNDPCKIQDFGTSKKIHALEEGTNPKPSAQFDPLPPSG
jgi:hypothetical protein